LRGPWRLTGILPIALVLILWAGTSRPELLISADGRVLGVLGQAGRAVNRDRGNGFVIENWLRNDGDLADQTSAALRDGFLSAEKATLFDLGASRIAYIWSKKADPAMLAGLCATADWVIAPQYRGDAPQGCRVQAKADFERSGAVAVRLDRDSLKITGAFQATGRRLWSRQ